MHRCTFTGLGGRGIYASSTVSVVVTDCTFKSCALDSLYFSSLPGDGLVANNYFAQSGGFDIDNASGANTSSIGLFNNVSYSPTSGHLSGFGDWTEANALVDSSSPFVSSTDLHLIPSSAGANAGLPGQWENLTAGLTSMPDVGAWQRQANQLLIAPQITIHEDIYS